MPCVTSDADASVVASVRVPSPICPDEAWGFPGASIGQSGKYKMGSVGVIEISVEWMDTPRYRHFSQSSDPVYCPIDAEDYQEQRYSRCTIASAVALMRSLELANFLRLDGSLQGSTGTPIGTTCSQSCGLEEVSASLSLLWQGRRGMNSDISVHCCTLTTVTTFMFVTG